MWRLICLVVFLLVFFFLSRRRLDWAVMFIVAALPFYLIKFKVLGIPFTLLEAMILISFFSWFFFNTRFKDFIRGKYGVKNYLAERKKRMVYPFGAELILLLSVSLVSVVVVGFTLGSWGIWKAYFFEPVLLFVLILNAFRNIDRKIFLFGRGEQTKIPPLPEGGQGEVGDGWIEKIILSLAAGALAVSVLAVIQKFTGLWIDNELWAAAETRRVVSFFGYPNAVGLYLAPIIIILTGYFLSLRAKNFLSREAPEAAGNDEARHHGAWKAIFIGLVIFLSALSVYFARCEGALAALLVVLVVLGMLAGKKPRLITIGLLLTAAAIIFLNPPLKDYAIKKITLMDLSGQIRRQQWAETWEMLKDGRIIQGSGLSNYQKAIEPYHQEGIFVNDGDSDFRRKIVIFDEKYKAEHWQPVEIYLYPHNIILNFWTELGLAGVLLFIWIIGKYFFISIKNLLVISKSKIKNSKFLFLGLLGAMVAVVIHGLVDVPYFKNDLACLFWIFVAILALVDKKSMVKEN